MTGSEACSDVEERRFQRRVRIKLDAGFSPRALRVDSRRSPQKLPPHSSPEEAACESPEPALSEVEGTEVLGKQDKGEPRVPSGTAEKVALGARVERAAPGG